MFESVSLPWLEAFKCLNQSLHSNYQRTWHTDTQTDTAFYSLGYFFLGKETKNSIYSSIYLRTDVSEKVQCVYTRQHGLLHPRVSHRGTQRADLSLLPLGPPPLHRLQDCAPLILWQLTLWVSVSFFIAFFSFLSISGTVSAISVIQCIAVLTNGVSSWLNRSLHTGCP